MTLQDTLYNILLQSGPHILALLDKNPYSVTFGSFDRKYWQYKIIDFPCGMQQELVLPLTFLWKNEFPDNLFFQLPRIKEYIQGIYLYHKKCCHGDGSMDDYFPHERAFGATAYALAAVTESALITGICPDHAVNAFEVSGDFLKNYREAGLLSNHLAIAALSLLNLAVLTGKERWRRDADAMISELKKIQHSEGWFPEYAGCDLGYQTVTVEFMARYYQKAPSDDLLKMLEKAVRFLRYFAHPDGSLGGEYGSRNTYNFYPGGFAILSNQIPEAADILALYHKGLVDKTCNYLEDDGIFGHLLSSYVTVLNSENLEISLPPSSEEVSRSTIHYFDGAGLFAASAGGYSVFGNTTKGGVYKVFKGSALLYSDTGLVGKLDNGNVFCQNNTNSSEGKVHNNRIAIQGRFKKYSCARLGRIQMVGLRSLSMIFGRLSTYSNVIRSIMQRLLIYSRRSLDIRFEREISIDKDKVEVRDKLFLDQNAKIAELYRSADLVNMHVITSDSFQTANLLPWEKLSFDPSEKNLEFIKTY
jgi:hypothetical protein